MYKDVYNRIQAEITEERLVLIKNPLLSDANGNTHEAQLLLGKSLKHALFCNKEWREFELSVAENIILTQPAKIANSSLESLPFHDRHWNWLKKYRILNGDDYDWFYVVTNGKLQAICITRHPYESVLDKKNIFYIEYISVAPWNRPGSFYKRIFKGVGSVLIQGICNYYNKEKGYRPGFALSAVPQAKGFYEHIGMTPIPEKDHDFLSYYEMSEEKSLNFMQGAKNE